MYTTTNFKTKKALKEALAAGQKLTVYQHNDLFGNTDKVATGTHVVYLEGPHYPAAHSWYAQATVVDGIITKLK